MKRFIDWIMRGEGALFIVCLILGAFFCSSSITGGETITPDCLIDGQKYFGVQCVELEAEEGPDKGVIIQLESESGIFQIQYNWQIPQDGVIAFLLVVASPNETMQVFSITDLPGGNHRQKIELENGITFVRRDKQWWVLYPKHWSLIPISCEEEVPHVDS